MISIAEQALSAGGSREQKREDVLIGFLDIAGRTGEDEVVPPVVRGLPTSRSDVIECDTLHAYASAAIGAHWSVPLEQPLPGVGIGVPARRQRGVLLRGPTGSLPGSAWATSWGQWPGDLI